MIRLLFRHSCNGTTARRPFHQPGKVPNRTSLRRNSSTNSTSKATESASHNATSETPPPPETPMWANKALWRRSFSYLITAIKFLAFSHLFATKILMVGICEGPSMLPTFPNTTSSILMSHLYARGRGIKVGDLITANRPDDMGIMLLKRVIGMPGDYVVVDPMAAGKGEETMMVQVPEGHCWIGGDNLPYSIDSRYYGPIPLGLVKSKVIAQISGGWRWFFASPFTPVEKWE